jgi:hypothetical protein
LVEGFSVFYTRPDGGVVFLVVEGGAPLVGGVAMFWWPFNFLVVPIDMCQLKSLVLLVHV